MASILVVDDSAVDRQLIEELLQEESKWTVHCSQNGAEALARIQDPVPELVVTDLQMPKMDGLARLPLAGRRVGRRVRIAIL